MKHLLPIIFISLTFCSVYSQNVADLKRSAPKYGFIENRGQIRDQDGQPNPDVRFLLPLPGNNVSLRTDGFSYDTYISESVKVDSLSAKGPQGSRISHRSNYKFHRVDIRFLGANPDVLITSEEPSSDYDTYYAGRSVESKVYHFGKITYRELYPGIDLEFVARPGSNKPVEYNFIIRPGAHMEDIKLEYDGGGQAFRVDQKRIEVTLAHGTLSENIPSSYWKESGKSEEVRYKELSRKNGKITVGYSGNLKKRRESLIIDPVPALEWGTLLGGSGQDNAYNVSVDPNGNVYFCGSTISPNNIATLTPGIHQPNYIAAYEGFIEKFSPDGTRMWGTYYSGVAGPYMGLGDEFIFDLTLDVQGNIYACGGAFLTGYILKLMPGGQLDWEYTFTVGGYLSSIVRDATGNIYVAAGLEYPDLTTVTSGSANGGYEYFLMKINEARQLQWAIFYGGSGNEKLDGAPISGMLPRICQDSQGSIYLVGATNSTNSTIVSPDGYQQTNAGLSDGCIAKFNSAGVRQWATYFGGTGGDKIWDVRSDAFGNVWVVGTTASPTGIALPAPGANPSSLAGLDDAFVAKFNSAGQQQWGTYYGGPDIDEGRGISTDPTGNIYITGQTRSTSGIATSEAYRTQIAGNDNNMIVKFNNSGELQWGTYSGGGGNANAIEYFSADAIYVTGAAYEGANYTTTDAHQTTFGGQTDAFLTKISAPCAAPVTLNITETPFICSVKFSTPRLSNCLATYLWNFGDGTTSLERSPIHVYATPGNYNVSVQITYNCSGCQNTTTLTKPITYTTPNNILEDRTIQVVTDQRTQVINAAASSFSDSWPLSQTNNTLDNKSSFLNGSQGVWRNNGSFAYVKDRKLSLTTNVASDGTYTLDYFSWKNAELNAVPNWVKATSMTRYSPFSFELENQDALGVYSAAVYDYNGQLPAANGVNMRQDEMAFTSFESIDGTVAGNWIINSGSVPAYTIYKVQAGNQNMAIVEASTTQLENVVDVDVVTFATYSTAFPHKKLYTKNKIICVRPHPQNAAWSMVVLETAPFEDIWSGQLRIKNVVTPTTTALFDGAQFHSGKQSLKITAEVAFKQDLLHLDVGKSYWINGWVSVGNASVATPVLGSNLGFDIVARQKGGQLISTFTFQPAGAVIEGWQQVKGSFICPANTAYIEIKFKQGSTGTAWYDDVRIHPENGNMKGYVYDVNDFRLRAVLDEENFASYFYYDREGNLHLTKKETTDGIKTLTENISYQLER